jgi:hypothetical protein
MNNKRKRKKQSEGSLVLKSNLEVSLAINLMLFYNLLVMPGRKSFFRNSYREES